MEYLSSPWNVAKYFHQKLRILDRVLTVSEIHQDTAKSIADFCRQYQIDDVVMLLLHLKQLEIQSTTSIIVNN